MKHFISKKIRVYGMVQGIGYRPFVKRLAEENGICGNVMNCGGSVTINAVGDREAMDRFMHSLISNAPNGAKVDKVTYEVTDNTAAHNEFSIISSESERIESYTLIPVDLPVCKNCEAELFDPQNMRYRYPFISCTSCGPRYSIIENIPYDRENITMKSFKMCKSCKNEYRNVDNIRCHAQTIGCHNCGPRLKAHIKQTHDVINVENLIEYSGDMSDRIGIHSDSESILSKAKDILLNGGIAAIKDIGGYHLVCMAENEIAAVNLRKVKGRELKPFAVMFRDMDCIREYCRVSELEEKELESVARPIVLLEKLKDFKGDVCGRSYEIGAMLPCNPLQMLILHDICEGKNVPLIMTSANRSGEPIITDDEIMKKWWETEALIDMVIYNGREIVTPLDDSLVHVVNDRVQVIRRSRGYVPESIEIEETVYNAHDIMAAGGDLKSSFCFYQNGRAYLSQYLGDLENDKIIKLYRNTFARMSRLLNIKPEMVITDKHPLYNSAKTATELADGKMQSSVQHHFAHSASVVAEHGITGKALAVVWDGTGYGNDGDIWGGEFILYDGSKENCAGTFMKDTMNQSVPGKTAAKCEFRESGFRRIGHIKEMQLIGGNKGAKNAETILYGYVTGLDKDIRGKFAESLEENEIKRYKTVESAIRCGINTVISTSAGRLFDGVCAALGICKYNQYEGQCAEELEAAAYSFKRKSETANNNVLKVYKDAANGRMSNVYNGVMVKKIKDEYIADTKSLFEKILQDILYSGCEKEEIALKFHYTLCRLIVDFCEMAGQEYETKKVILSGGTFQNRILLTKCISELENKGFEVYINEKVPSGDGGIALGQVLMGLNQINAE